MDASTRWETEAIRSGSTKRAVPPRPSAKRGAPRQSDRTWVTLKEAESLTGIPSNTLRKWVRKDTIETYLESDGEVELRMVDLISIRARAEELGRELAPPTHTQGEAPAERDPQPRANTGAAPETGVVRTEPAGESPTTAGETMLVPIDAWNKMLDQLGNLHEAGQQLAEARERAAKAETEATFLRERLREIRTHSGDRNDTAEIQTSQVAVPDATPDDESASAEAPAEQPSHTPETTTYWRYLTTGWRDRKRRT